MTKCFENRLTAGLVYNTPCKQIQPLSRINTLNGPRVRRISPVGGCGSSISRNSFNISIINSSIFSRPNSCSSCSRKINWTISDPVNLAPTGPILSIRLARASPSLRGGGLSTFSTRTSLHVMRVGSQVRPGGTIMRTPECRKPRIAPPRASTTKLTRNLQPMIFSVNDNENKHENKHAL